MAFLSTPCIVCITKGLARYRYWLAALKLTQQFKKDLLVVLPLTFYLLTILPLSAFL